MSHPYIAQTPANYPAGRVRRLYAWLIDFILVSIPFVNIAWIIALLWTSRNNQSPAKMLLKIQTIGADGEKISQIRYLLREAFRMAPRIGLWTTTATAAVPLLLPIAGPIAFIGGCMLIADFFTWIFSREQKTLTDRIFKTQTVRK